MEGDNGLASQSQQMQEYSQTLLNEIRTQKAYARATIESLILGIIDAVVENRHPCLERPRLLVNSKEMRKAASGRNLTTKIRFHKRSTRSFTMQVHVMSIVYRMIQQNQTSTIRDLYYENMNFYGNQNRLVTALSQMSLLLKVPREALCVEASAKGLIAGAISFTTAEGDVIRASNSRHGIIVPNKLHELTINTDARFILFVEKDAIFQRLLEENVLEVLGPMILITGKGYPDIQTRRLMGVLNRIFQLKVYAMVDCDPYGVEIAAVIKWGSYKGSSGGSDNMWQRDLTVPDLVWLGLLPTEVSSLSLTYNASAELNDKDKKKLESVIERIDLQAHDRDLWLQEVNGLKDLGRKTELEALFSSPTFTTRVYLRSKLFRDISLSNSNNSDYRLLLSQTSNYSSA